MKPHSKSPAGRKIVGPKQQVNRNLAMQHEIPSKIRLQNTPSISTSNSQNSLKNLQKGIYLKKTQKFEFKREKKHGVRIARHWILRLFYWFKCQNHFSDMSDNKVYTMIADIACCGRSTVEQIIQSGEIYTQDNRGHPMNKAIASDMEEEIKQDVILNLKDNLEKGIPVSAKDVRSWLLEGENITLGKTTMCTYLKNWGICWHRLRHEEFRKKRNYVLSQRYYFLNEVNEELNTPLKSCRHRNACACKRQRKIVFIDESYLHQHHVSNFGLTIENFPLVKPSGKGKRIVIAAGFTANGWLGLNYNNHQLIFLF